MVGAAIDQRLQQGWDAVVAIVYRHCPDVDKDEEAQVGDLLGTAKERGRKKMTGSENRNCNNSFPFVFFSLTDRHTPHLVQGEIDIHLTLFRGRQTHRQRDRQTDRHLTLCRG